MMNGMHAMMRLIDSDEHRVFFCIDAIHPRKCNAIEEIANHLKMPNLQVARLVQQLHEIGLVTAEGHHAVDANDTHKDRRKRVEEIVENQAPYVCPRCSLNVTHVDLDIAMLQEGTMYCPKCPNVPLMYEDPVTLQAAWRELDDQFLNGLPNQSLILQALHKAYPHSLPLASLKCTLAELNVLKSRSRVAMTDDGSWVVAEMPVHRVIRAAWRDAAVVQPRAPCSSQNTTISHTPSDDVVEIARILKAVDERLVELVATEHLNL